ncbi:MAG: motility associated factor glycosyltransferase family protein [Deltaproteobacteria bacterium]|nr:motility associated factor glycosyltransferase family protein [Deltaproteobacteria bacterium]
MSSLYQKNLNCLKTKHPQLAELVSNLNEIPALKFRPSTRELICHFADGSEQPYYPSPNAEQYSKEFAQTLSLKNPRILIFFGVGLGHHLLEYAKKSHPLNQVILVIEAMPHLFKKALEVNDFTPMFEVPQVHWFLGNDVVQLEQFFNRFFEEGPWLRFANAVEFVEFSPSLHWNGDFYSQAKESFAKATAHHFNRVFADPYDAYRGTVHVLKNLKEVLAMPALAQAQDQFKGKDGILISSGPSLAKSLSYLKEAQQYAVVVACPSALPLLIEHGIHPHLWLNIERDETQGDFFCNLSEKPPHVFVGPPHVHPKCFSGNKGLNSYILGTSLQSRWLPLEKPILGLGHSSANAAFKILELLGCGRIFLVGQDLCYDKNLESHAPGVWKESQTVMANLRKEGNKVLEIEGNNGKPVRSNLFWFTFLKTFSEQLVPAYAGKVFNVIPPEYGAKIPGCPRIDPEAWLQQLSPEKLETLSLLKEKLTLPSTAEQEIKRKVIQQKMYTLKRALQRLIGDNQAFAMKCRALQFSAWVAAQNWEEGKIKYAQFLKEADEFSSRYTEDKNYAEDLDAYQNFFHPIIQGTLIQGQIQYFSSTEDTEGNFNEIARKIEILFQMAKEEAFWASVVLDLVNKF